MSASPMWASPDLIAGVLEAEPKFAASCYALGRWPADVAYEMLGDLADSPPWMRDNMMAFFAEKHGLVGVRSLKDFGNFVEEFAARFTGEVSRLEDRPFSPKLSRDEQADHFAQQSQLTQQPWSAEGIKHFGKKAAVAVLTNGLSKRLASRDGDPAPGLDEKYRPDVDDRAHVRSLIAAGLGDTQRPSRYADKTPSSANLGDIVAAAYDLEDERAWEEERNRDPDDDNRRMSNTLFEAD